MRLRHGNGHVQTHQTDQFVTRFKLVFEKTDLDFVRFVLLFIQFGL